MENKALHILNSKSATMTHEPNLATACFFNKVLLEPIKLYLFICCLRLSMAALFIYYLFTVYGCFNATKTELSSCD